MRRLIFLSIAAAMAVPSYPAAAQVGAGGLTAADAYAKLVDRYLAGDLAEATKALADATRNTAGLTAAQRADIAYIRSAMGDHQPAWWKLCSSTTKTNLQVSLWGSQLTTAFLPADKPAFEAKFNTATKRFATTVSWQPGLIGSATPIKGPQTEPYGINQGHLAEVNVWRQLGHVWLVNCLPSQQVGQLINNDRLLLDVLQDFYAEATAMYYCTPRGRIALLLVRLDALDSEQEQSARGAQALGAYLLANWLAEPRKWPSVRFPPQVPAKDIEAMTIQQVYANIDPAWTLAEDRELRESIKKLMTGVGPKLIANRGTIVLPNNLEFKLLGGDDKELKPKRDAWVADKLKSLRKVL